MSFAPGYYSDEQISMKQYIADPCDEPSLSTGVVSELYERTPAHAWTHHPRFGKVPSETTSRGEIGSAVHSLAFGGAKIVYVGNVSKRSGPEKGIPFLATDWETKDAQDARDEIRAAGGLPLLERQRNDVERAAENVAKALAEFGSGKCEQTMLWKNDGVWQRGRVDWMDDAGKVDVDLKTVDSADRATWIRRVLHTNHLDIQCGLRDIGHSVLGGKDVGGVWHPGQREMRWLLVELTRPWATAWVIASPKLLEDARRKILHASKLWRKSLDSNEWPAYGSAAVYAESPAHVQWDLESRGVA